MQRKDGLQRIVWRQAAGTLTVLPERGRILQATVGGAEAFWANPRWTGDWNVGGDRLWLAPEADFHWGPRRKGAAPYVVPASVDPGRWDVERQAPGFCQVRQRVALPHRHRAATVRCDVTRSFTGVALPDAPGFVAYRTDTELKLLDGPRGQPVGMWFLLQVPSGGELIVGCRQRPARRTHFGSVPARLSRTGRGALRLRITGDHRYKIGVPPPVVSGRMAYVRPVGRNCLVIARQFFPQPWRAYCDGPQAARGTPGDAVQVYNDSGELGGFGEMETHAPALTVGCGADRLMDSSLTLVGLVAARDWPRWQRAWFAGTGPL